MRTGPDTRTRERHGGPRAGAWILLAGTAATVLVGRARGHVGAVETATRQPPIPLWFVVLTAGVVVGSSFLFTSLVADHESLEIVNGLGLRARVPDALETGLPAVLQVAGVAVVGAVVAVGLSGPAAARRNAATLGVWAGWWGGYTMTTYLLGNTWPAVDPFRRLAALVPGDGVLDYPDGLGAWPSVAGLLLIVWLEVATAISSKPRLLAGLVVLYALGTLAGTALVGRGPWFGRVDPIAAVFRTYGRVAPVQRTDGGLELRLPGAALTDDEVPEMPGRSAFVVALLWATTFDGMVSTPAVQAVLRPVVGSGVPAQLLYLAVLGAGFALFYGVYRAACRRSRRSADTYVTGEAIERWFAPSLVPIAAGYHLAHFFPYVLSLAPALVATLQAPLAGTGVPPPPVLPDWLGFVQLSVVLLGHLLAIWVAHSIAFELFPGARQPIRSQYPMVLVMIAYTMVSAWVIVSPTRAVILS